MTSIRSSARWEQTQYQHIQPEPKAAGRKGEDMKRVMIGSVVVICSLVIWGFFAHTAWSQTDVIRAILGHGIAGFIPEFTDQNQIADSVIFQDANGAVGIGTTSPSPAKLLVNQAGPAAATDSVISGVNGVAPGDASGINSLLDAIRGDATGSATGADSEVDAIRGQTTGSAVGSDSELDGVVGRSFGDASGPASQLTGVRGRVTGNATGQGAQVVGVRGRSSGSAMGPGTRTIGVLGTVDGTATGQPSAAFGVVGFARTASGNATGVQGSTNSPDGQGVLGFNNSASSVSSEVIGIWGVSPSSPKGTGVRGDGPGIGVHGISTGVAGQFDGRVQINCPTFPCVTINGFGFFDMAENLPLVARVTPGEVVVVTEGKGGYGIAPASLPYDTRVAGIVSANPPVVLQNSQYKQTAPVAMAGIVKAEATAANGPIHVGDLLTTSGIPGHLMRCPTALRCVGAVVSKALEPLAKGESQILVMLWRQ